MLSAYWVTKSRIYTELVHFQCVLQIKLFNSNDTKYVNMISDNSAIDELLNEVQLMKIGEVVSEL